LFLEKHVLQDTYPETSENTQNKEIQKTYFRNVLQGEIEKALSNNKSRPFTTMGGAQVHSIIDHPKVVATGACQGVGTPRVRPHPSGCHLGPASIDGSIAVCYGSFGRFPYLPASNQPSFTISKGLELICNTHIIWSYIPHLSTYTL
jgi:hypothetical protein